MAKESSQNQKKNYSQPTNICVEKHFLVDFSVPFSTVLRIIRGGIRSSTVVEPPDSVRMVRSLLVYINITPRHFTVNTTVDRYVYARDTNNGITRFTPAHCIDR